MEDWRVPLPKGVREPFDVYLNGVEQRPEIDFRLEGRELRFAKPRAKQGKRGPVGWLSMRLGIAGTYRNNDSVDVIYTVEGRRVVATGLPVIPPEG
jgi:hypothetical protein